MKKLLIVLLAALLLSRPVPAVIAQDDDTGGDFGVPSAFSLNLDAIIQQLVGDDLLLFFTGFPSSIQLTLSTPSGVTYNVAGNPAAVIQDPSGVNTLVVRTADLGEDVVVGAQADTVGGSATTRTGSGLNGLTDATTVGTNGPNVTGAGPMGHGGNVNPYAQFFEEQINSGYGGEYTSTAGNDNGSVGAIIASPSPCVNDPQSNPCTTYISVKMNSQPCHYPQWCGAKVIAHDVTDPNWYTFEQIACHAPCEQDQVPAPWISQGHQYEFRLQDNGGHLIAKVKVDYGSEGQITPSPDGQNLTVNTFSSVTRSQIWISCTSWPAGWYLWQTFSGSPNGWQGSTSWMALAPNSCTLNFYDISPGVYGGSRLMRTRTMQAHSGGFAPVQAPSGPPPGLKKGTPPHPPKVAATDPHLPKYTGAVQ